MKEAVRSLAEVCAVLLVAELAVRLAPKNDMVRFVQSLFVLVLLLSALRGFLSLRTEPILLQPEEDRPGEQLTEAVNDALLRAAEQDTEEYLAGLFATLQIKAEKILPEADIREDSGIVLKKVTAVFRYESDSERAGILLKNVLGEDVEVEVVTDEG